MKLMLTGHRTVDPAAKEGMKELLSELKETTQDLVAISGGNMGTKWKKTGADRYWALAAYELGIPYEIMVPRGYGRHYYGHSSEMMGAFESMLAHAQHVQYAPNIEPFHWSANFMRNTAMVNSSSHFAVCSNVHPRSLLSEKSGGTVDAVKKIVKAGEDQVYWIHAETGKYEGLVRIKDIQEVLDLT